MTARALTKEQPMKHETPRAADAFEMMADVIAVKVAALITASQPVAAPEPDADEVWNSRQVCEYLGIKPTTLNERQKLSGFPATVNKAGHRKWLASDIRAYQPAPSRSAN
jgi:hypothetical protein